MQAILAVDHNWGLATSIDPSGINRPTTPTYEIPWLNHPLTKPDLLHYSQFTKDKILWVTKSTYLGLPLRVRTKQSVAYNILTRNPQHLREFTFSSLVPEQLGPNHILIGGFSAYSEFLMSCTDIYLTKFSVDFECDLKLPKILITSLMENCSATVYRKGPGYHIYHLVPDKFTT